MTQYLIRARSALLRRRHGTSRHDLSKIVELSSSVMYRYKPSPCASTAVHSSGGRDGFSMLFGNRPPGRELNDSEHVKNGCRRHREPEHPHDNCTICEPGSFGSLNFDLSIPSIIRLTTSPYNRARLLGQTGACQVTAQCVASQQSASVHCWSRNRWNSSTA